MGLKKNYLIKVETCIKKQTIILKLYFIQNEKIMSFFYLNFII